METFLLQVVKLTMHTHRHARICFVYLPPSFFWHLPFLPTAIVRRLNQHTLAEGWKKYILSRSQTLCRKSKLHVFDAPTASYSRWHVWQKNFSANYRTHLSYSSFTDWCCAEKADWGYFFHSGKKCINKNIQKYTGMDYLWNLEPV